MASNPYTHWAALDDSEVTVETLRKHLAPIQDDLWVAAACVDRIVDDVEAQRSLLELGIARTDDAVERGKNAVVFLSTSDVPIDRDVKNLDASRATNNEDIFHDTLITHFGAAPVDAQLCILRTVLLERLDRLNTYAEICKDAPNLQENEIDDETEEWEDDPWGDQETTIHETKSSIKLPILLSEFLVDSLVSSSCQLASLHWFGALRTLFRRHGSLWPYCLRIMASIPEHVHPSEYIEVFNITTSEPHASLNSWRLEQDWSEIPAVRSVLTSNHLRLDIPYERSAILTQNPYVPLTATELSTWYINRADEIISTTGLIDNALAIIQHGISQGITGLDELEEDLSLLSRFIYDAPQGPTIEDWTISRWRSMEPPAIIRAYLAYSTPESLPHDITRLVMPYLFVLESRLERRGDVDSHLPKRLLYDYILSAPLEMAVAVFEASKPTLPTAQRIIRDDEDIARLALACLYGSDDLYQWSTMSRIFECLPAWDVSIEADGDADIAKATAHSLETFVAPSINRPRPSSSDLLYLLKSLSAASLSRALDVLDVHLESGEILSRWNVPAPLSWFLQSNSDVTEQNSWANRMVRRAGGAEDRLNSTGDWEWLLEDMLKLSNTSSNGIRGAFGLLSQDKIIHIFFSGLLSTGKFDIARDLLRSPKSKLTLTSAETEEICLACSREFYDNASTGNYTFGEMKLAYDCLNVPEPSKRLLEEKEFIEATSRISSFNITSRPGIPISPIEIRLTKDRLSLVSRVLSSNSDAYKHTEVILDLVRKLGFTGDIVAEVKTLAMMADTALQTEDFIYAYELSERMSTATLSLRSSVPMNINDPRVNEVNEVCWVTCFQLGRQPEFHELNKKLSLLGHALELCPQEKLHDVLIAWRRLEKDNIEACEKRLSFHQTGTVISDFHKHTGSVSSYVTSSLRARLQDFHIPSPPLLSTPDAAALASRTFRSVAANFPFSVSHHHSQPSDGGRSGSHAGKGNEGRVDGEDVSTQATRVLSKGIGWLIGADEEL